MNENDETTQTPRGIGSYLRDIATKEGDAAAVKQANRWLNTLEEMHEIACPTVDGTRPGGPQKFCVAVLIRAVNRFLADNPLAKQQAEAAAADHEETATEDDKGKNV